MSSRDHGGDETHPPRQTAYLFSILCPQSIHSRRFTSSRKSLLLNSLRDSGQSIISKADTRKVFLTKHLSGAPSRFAESLVLKDRCRRPQAVHHHGNSSDGHSRCRRLTPAFLI